MPCHGKLPTPAGTSFNSTALKNQPAYFPQHTTIHAMTGMSTPACNGAAHGSVCNTMVFIKQLDKNYFALAAYKCLDVLGGFFIETIIHEQYFCYTNYLLQGDMQKIIVCVQSLVTW